ncbi:class I tRNA ligase family protein, partial [Mycoplasmopsis bovis]|uniref:class I tRNA ligase family protein n=1 Tax=Mycoplasmopsis bovis TaxID=28903 RepID=UPI003D2B13DC
GLVYKGLKPVYWSPSSQTALAEAEVEYYDVDSPSIYVALEIVYKNGSQKVKNGDKLVIWTTTPWTILANAAVAIGENFTYCRVEYNNQGYIVAKELANKFIE